MSTNIHKQVAAARAGSEPALICQVPSGWVVLSNMQYLPGYSILLPDPVVPSLNDLDRAKRSEYLCDMSLVGDALLEVTGAYRINYAIMGNSDPALHAHIVPRFSWEPEKLRKGGPWSYDQSVIETRMFDQKRDRDLIEQLTQAIQNRFWGSLAFVVSEESPSCILVDKMERSSKYVDNKQQYPKCHP